MVATKACAAKQAKRVREIFREDGDEHAGGGEIAQCQPFEGAAGGPGFSDGSLASSPHASGILSSNWQCRRGPVEWAFGHPS